MTKRHSTLVASLFFVLMCALEGGATTSPTKSFSDLPQIAQSKISARLQD
jgi:hypothetical protein